MKFIRFAFLGIVFASACTPDSSRQEAPVSGMTHERSGTPVSTSTPSQLPATGPGNFENLVDDYENKDRGIWQKPDMVIALLGDLEGKTVADIGAGTGYFTFRLIPKAKKVIGIDIDRRFIHFMDSIKVRLSEPYRNRFESRLAKYDDPMLAPEEADAVMIVNTYGYIENRVQYLKTLYKGMSPGARLLVIDFKKNNLPIGPPEAYKVALRQVESEMLSAGFSIEKMDTKSLDYQYIVIVQKPQ
jgi:ubiquinone/menaquinone biosynthesis C-methylase UbiE